MPASFLILLCLIPALLLAACDQAPSEPERLFYAVQGSTMGTYYVVKVVQEPGEPLSDEQHEGIKTLVEKELNQVDRLMSTYRDDSELSRFNATTDTEPFAVSPETAEVIREALTVHSLTQGALDVTIGPLVNAWGFGAETEVPPSLDDEQIEELKATVGSRFLGLEGETLTKGREDLYVDLSSLAKGFAVDLVFQAVSALGHDNLLVEVGGEVRTSGINPDGQIWRLGIERPSASLGQIQRIVALDRVAMATSGDYRNYRERDGVRISHLIDPRTGRPIGHRLASVSVIDESCMRADALATALMVMGPEEGLELANRENIPALFLIRDDQQFRELPSRAFEQRFLSGSST